MTTNSQILTALNDTLVTAALGHPISWPGVDFTPPDANEWLEVTFLPNVAIDQWIANDSETSPRGIYQIEVFSRPQSELKIQSVVEAVQAVFSKGTGISGNVRVSRPPYASPLNIEPDRMSVAVTIEYSE